MGFNNTFEGKVVNSIIQQNEGDNATQTATLHNEVFAEGLEKVLASLDDAMAEVKGVDKQKEIEELKAELVKLEQDESMLNDSTWIKKIGFVFEKTATYSDHIKKSYDNFKPLLGGLAQHLPAM